MGKIRELDDLRGLLAVWVVCVHLLATAGVNPSSFGFLAPLFGEHMRVQIFCILSGFVIFLMQSRRPESYGTFMMGRLLRIYPAYLVAFVLSVLCADFAMSVLQTAPYPGPRGEVRIVLMQSAFDRMPEHLLAHLTLLHGLIPEGWLPNAAYAFLGQAWNISTEFQFYLVAPLLFLGLATGPRWRRIAVAVSGVGLWYLLHDWPNPADLAQYAPYFVLGILSFFFWQRDWSDRRHLNPLVVLALSGLTFAFADMATGIWAFILGSLALRRDQGRIAWGITWLSTKPMQDLGRISYSLYLLHMMPLYVGMAMLNDAGLDRKPYLLLLTVVTFSLALPMSWICAHYVEAPANALKRRERARATA